jgi:tetratricopeptide (TPR) repeat protein
MLSVPIYDFALANEELAIEATDGYYPCCGKNICRGCAYSSYITGNIAKCPFCNSNRASKTQEEKGEEMTTRAEANDAASICMLADSHYNGLNGFQQDQTKAIELFTKSAELGSSQAQFSLGNIHYQGGSLKKAKFHFEAAAMAGHEVARYNIGNIEAISGNMERAVKHWKIAASAGSYHAMHTLKESFKEGHISRETINLTVKAYNNACAEMRSEARDARIKVVIEIG